MLGTVAAPHASSPGTRVRMLESAALPSGPSARTPKSRSNGHLEDHHVTGHHDLDRALASDVRASEHANRAEHGQPAIVELLRLVALPASVRIPLRRAQEVSWLVVRPPAVQNANHLNEHDEREDLQPAELRHLNGSLQRVIAEVLEDAREERRGVGGDHAEARQHRHAAVLQLCLAVPATSAAAPQQPVKMRMEQQRTPKR